MRSILEKKNHMPWKIMMLSLAMEYGKKANQPTKNSTEGKNFDAIFRV